MDPEQEARVLIDTKLKEAGWVVQDYKQLDFRAGEGVAIRVYPLSTGFADYLLFINRKVVGVVEAKKAGYTLSGVEGQSAKYLSVYLSSI